MSDLCDDCPPVGYPTDKTRCAPCPRRTDVATDTADRREAIARIIDPRNWVEAGAYRARADEWFANGRTKPGDPLTDGYRQKAQEIVVDSLAKADAILTLIAARPTGDA